MSNPDWWLDPPEERETPPCPECDVPMERKQISRAVWYECNNPACSCGKMFRTQDLTRYKADDLWLCDECADDHENKEPEE